MYKISRSQKWRAKNAIEVNSDSELRKIWQSNKAHLLLDYGHKLGDGWSDFWTSSRQGEGVAARNSGINFVRHVIIIRKSVNMIV